jgi:hypothetical protein
MPELDGRATEIPTAKKIGGLLIRFAPRRHYLPDVNKFLRLRESKQMKKLTITSLGFLVLMSAFVSPELGVAQRRRAVVVRRPPVRPARLVVHARHPLRRALPPTVVVRPARRVVTVGAPLVFLPSVAWTPAVAPLPAGERLVWQDSEQINRDEGWVDSNFGVDSSGHALFLDINGETRLNFAEVTFANGQVQVIDFNERAHRTGIYRLLDFADGRHVKTVRILAKSESDESNLTVYLSKV